MLFFSKQTQNMCRQILLFKFTTSTFITALVTLSKINHKSNKKQQADFSIISYPANLPTWIVIYKTELRTNAFSRGQFRK